MNANTDTRDYEFPANADFRLVYENIHKNLYEKLKDNEIITRYKRNLEVMFRRENRYGREIRKSNLHEDRI